ncbi:2-dehydropantoate 2-reductase (Ketopantoate reductase) (KPA reductase) (KPR) [Cryptotrichosporon argae]
MRFHVLGIGSIGTLVAHHLRQTSRAPVTLVVRNARRFRQNKYLVAESAPAAVELRVTRDGATAVSTGYDLEVTNPHKAESLAAARAPGAVFDSPGSPASTLNSLASADAVVATLDAADPTGPIASLIVCTKGVQTAAALTPLVPRLGPRSVITLLQNGMGVYDELCARLFPDPARRPYFVLGTTTHGATVVEHGHVRHLSRPGQGNVQLGLVPDPRGEVDFESWLWPNGDVGPLTAPTSAPSIPPSPVPGFDNLRATLLGLGGMAELSPAVIPTNALYHQLLLKLALNSVVNPLTALLGGGFLPNGMLAAGSLPGARLVRALADELSAVLTAYVHSLAAPHPAQPDVVALFAPSAIARRVTALAAATSANTSSMATDIKTGNPTEIDYVNGFVVGLGRQLGVSTPLNQMLRQMVKFRTELVIGKLPAGGAPGAPAPAPAGATLGGPDVRAAEKAAAQERKLALDERKVRLLERRLELDEGLWRERVQQRRAASRSARKEYGEAVKASGEHSARHRALYGKAGAETAAPAATTALGAPGEVGQAGATGEAGEAVGEAK